MFRIDVPSATPEGLFTEGSPTGGVSATVVSADWLNSVQEELMSILTAAGVAPVKGDDDQVMQSILALMTGGLGQGGSGGNDYIKIPFRDKTTGVRRELIVQWGELALTAVANGQVSGTFTHPIAFPTANLKLLHSIRSSATSMNYQSYRGGTSTLTSSQMFLVCSSGTPGVPVPIEIIVIGI